MKNLGKILQNSVGILVINTLSFVEEFCKESGGSKDLSGLTQRDPVPSQSILQQPPQAPSRTKCARSWTTSHRSLSPQWGHQLGTNSTNVVD